MEGIFTDVDGERIPIYHYSYFDYEEEEILASESGKYSLTKEQLNVDAKARVLAGGLSPKILFK